MNENFNFTKTFDNSEIEISNVPFDIIIEETSPNSTNNKTDLYKKISELKNDLEYDYYFFYTYDLDISNSKEKNTVNDFISIYIGKGKINRVLQYKRAFHSLPIFKRIEEKMIIKKKILHILRKKKTIKNIDLSNIPPEKSLIEAEESIFNREYSEYYKYVKNEEKDPKMTFIEKYLLELKKNPSNILGIFEEYGVLDKNYTKEKLFEELKKVYKKQNKKNKKPTHKEKIKKLIEEENFCYCDDCLSEKLNIYPRQTINSNVRKLANEVEYNREIQKCEKCMKNKKILYKREN